MQSCTRVTSPSRLTCTAGPHVARVKAFQSGTASERLDVAIVGGGPGGLAAASAILVARPYLVVGVFERSTLRPRGASLAVQPNGLRALGAIHPRLQQAVQDIDSRPGVRRHFAADGTLISKQDEDSPLNYVRTHGGPLSMCAWHRLQAALASQLPPGVLRQDAAFDKYEEQLDEEPTSSSGELHENGGAACSGAGTSCVTVHFKRGSHPPVQASLLIGCDGGQSGVRAQCLGGEPSLFADTAVWRAVMPRPDWWFDEPGAYCIFGMPPTMILAFALVDGTVAWQAFGPWPAERLDEIGGGGAAYTQDPVARREQGEARRRRALEVFGSWGANALSLINGADVMALTEHPQFYRAHDTCKVWGRGRVTLLGDAAHLSTPILAQGTSQAFEDALALGRAIGEHGVTPEALRAYEAFRQPQMEPIHAESVRLFLNYRAGGPPPKEHLDNHRMGNWQRPLPPLRPAAPEVVA